MKMVKCELTIVETTIATISFTIKVKSESATKVKAVTIIIVITVILDVSVTAIIDAIKAEVKINNL